MRIGLRLKVIKESWLNRHRSHESHLSDLFEHSSPNMSVEQKARLVQNLFSWLREPLPNNRSFYPQLTRLKFLLLVLEKNPHWKLNLSLIIKDLILQSELSHFLALSGLPRKKSLFSEIVDRLSRRYLPQAPECSEIGDLISLFFIDENEPKWLLSIDPIQWQELTRLLFSNNEFKSLIQKHWQRSIKASLVYLSSQMETLMFSPELHRRTNNNHITKSSFWNLRFEINHWVELQGNFDSTPEEELAALIKTKETLVNCRKEVNSILKHLDDKGLSIDIIFEIDLVERYLARFEYNLQLMEEGYSLTETLTDLIAQHLQGTHLKPLFQNNFYLLSRSLVDRFSESGEHYITRNLAEYRQMFKSAAGGGVLTALTTVFKFFITKAQAPLFIEGFFYGLNYAGSFLTMSLFHFTLATKQPAMTAPALSSKLKSIKQRDQIQSFIDEVANLMRSQFIAAIGNVGLVIPTALFIHLFYQLLFGQPIIDQEYSKYTLSSLNPFSSLTLFYAVLTGAILFLASVIAGYIENWFVYRKLDIALKNSISLQALIGKNRTIKASKWLKLNLSGMVGSLVLGFALAFAPIFGKFFGLPIDIRHVTLSAGSWAIAASNLYVESFPWFHFIGASLGIIVIGLLNFSVSFVLALLVAIQAQKIRRSWLREILRQTLLAIKQNPWYFLLPQKDVTSNKLKIKN